MRWLLVKNSVINNYSNQVFSTPTTISHCWFDSLDCAALPPNVTCGPGILVGGDPMFMNPDSGDFRLQPCSPLLHAGDNSAAAGLLTDLDGNPRIVGPAVDIGPYEMPAPVLAAEPVVQPSCPGGASGSVGFEPQGMCAPYTWVWSAPGGGQGQTLDGFAAGTYTFTVTDARGSSLQFEVAVPEGAAPEFLSTALPVICGDTTGGSAAVSMSGAVPPLAYNWADDALAADSLRSGLAAGTYSATVTDARGCSATGSIEVDKSGGLSAQFDIDPISCFGAADASISVSANDGKSPYTWTWDTGETGPSIGPLGPGDYRGTLTDAYGCTLSWVLPLEQPDSISVSALLTQTSGASAADGSIQLDLSGGTPPWHTEWSTGAVDVLLLDSLSAGAYAVLVTDANGCSKSATFTLGVSAGGELSLSENDWSVSPNPAHAVLRVYRRAPAHTDMPVRLYDAAGRLLLRASWPAQTTEIQLDVRHLPAGAYWLAVGERAERVVVR